MPPVTLPQHPPFPQPGGHSVRDRHADTLLLSTVFSKLDGLTRSLAPLLPAPARGLHAGAGASVPNGPSPNRYTTYIT
jgi:hypothetical protein